MRTWAASRSLRRDNRMPQLGIMITPSWSAKADHDD